MESRLNVRINFLKVEHKGFVGIFNKTSWESDEGNGDRYYNIFFIIVNQSKKIKV